VNYPEVHKELSARFRYTPEHLTTEEIKWVEDTALRINDSKLEGEDHFAAIVRLEPHSKEEARRLFPDTPWGFWLDQFLLHEVCRLNNSLPIW
jgi:hypothetical protein